MICNAHLLRELKYFCEVDKYKWSEKMRDFLKKQYVEVEQLKREGRKKRSSKDFKLVQRDYRRVLKEAKSELRELVNKKGKKQEPVVNLFRRMKKHEKAILWFSRDFSVPFTNNLAERDLRMAKVHQKISGCFRSEDAARNWFRMRSFISTMKKRQLNVLEGIKALYDPNIKSPIYSVLGPPG